jgi:hypothetical protein
VSDPEKIVQKRNEKPISPVLYLDIYLSFPKYGVKSIEDLDFDLKFEQNLFITKSESSLNKIIFDEKRFQDLILAASIKPLFIPNQNHQPLQVLTTSMAARFVPLVVPDQLHDLPQEYNQRIKLYDAEGNVSAQKHLVWFNDFVDLEEVDYEDAKMRLFAQSLVGEVQKWLIALPTTSIQNFEAFETKFCCKVGRQEKPPLVANLV